MPQSWFLTFPTLSKEISKKRTDYLDSLVGSLGELLTQIYVNHNAGVSMLHN